MSAYFYKFWNGKTGNYVKTLETGNLGIMIG